MFANFLEYLLLLIVFNVKIEHVLSILNSEGMKKMLYGKNCYFSVLPEAIARLDSNKIFFNILIKNSKYFIACIKSTSQFKPEIEVNLNLPGDEKQTASFLFVNYESFLSGNFHIPNQSSGELLKSISNDVITAYNTLTPEQKEYTNSVVLIPQDLIGLVNKQDIRLVALLFIPETYFYVLFHSSLPGGQYILDEKINFHMHEIKKLLKQ